ncbi:MAG: hypothetical protein FJW34_04130 [Acidobacteria bacterium]|nr:hypothetical protein [Acidobacteriota bacterium]
MAGRAGRVVAGVAAVAALTVAAYWSLRLAYAEALFAQDSRESVRRAIELAPTSARYRVRQAELLDRLEEEGPRLAVLEKAAALNPLDSAVWIELGLLAETNGDPVKAEKCLLEAVRVDKTHDPRSALAHYYFRSGEREKFWKWVRQAAGTAYGEMTPLFRLCWWVSQDGSRILERAIPERPEALRQYVPFLLGERRWEAAAEAAGRLIVAGSVEDAPLLLACCDRMLEERRVEAAVALWNGMAARKLINYAALRPERGVSLTNGGFETGPRSRGFDWRLGAAEGLTVTLDAGQPVLRMHLSGGQPEQCEILWQYVVVLPGRSYRFRWEYETEGFETAEGLGWEVEEVTRADGVMARWAQARGETWREGSGRFNTPGDFRLARIALRYQRAPGTRRIEGTLSLRNLRLELDR